MFVTLPPETEAFVRSQIKAGRFASPEQLVQEAVTRFMCENQAEELDDQTLAAIDEGQAEIDRGEGMDLETFKAELQRRTGLKLR